MPRRERLDILEDMLAANPQVDAVFCENDSMCLGAQTAIADAGRSDEMFLVGVDGETVTGGFERLSLA